MFERKGFIWKEKWSKEKKRKSFLPTRIENTCKLIDISKIIVVSFRYMGK